MKNKKQEVLRKYDATADKYDSRYKQIQFTKYREILSFIKLRSEDIIIDIGCGTALFLDFLLQYDINIISCDFSYKMLLEGKKKHPNSCFVCADADLLPFKKNSCDVLTFFSILQNSPKPVVTLNEGILLLKENGKIILSVLTKIYNLDDLSKLAKDADIEVEKIWKLKIEDFCLIGKKKDEKSIKC